MTSKSNLIELFKHNAIKYTSLVLLVGQSSAHALYLRWISVRPVKERFLSPVCVLMQEIVKLVTCFILVCFQQKSVIECCRQLYIEFFINWFDTLKMCVPGIIYVIQNNLTFVAVANLPTAVYMVSYQLKILTTAFFTVTFLRRRLSLLQWISLVFLFIGIALVQLDQKTQQDARKKTAEMHLRNDQRINGTGKSNLNVPEQNLLIGLLAVFITCILSGFSGIYLEKLLKEKAEVSVWLRNIQLAIISVPTAFATIYIKSYDAVIKKGFWVGFDISVWGVISIAAFGGLVVGAVIKFADNILKAFATSFAIIITCIFSVVFFNFKLTIAFVAGTALVIASIFGYNVFPYVPPVDKKSEESEKAVAKTETSNETPIAAEVPISAAAPPPPPPPPPPGESTTVEVSESQEA